MRVLACVVVALTIVACAPTDQPQAGRPPATASDAPTDVRVDVQTDSSPGRCVASTGARGTDLDGSAVWVRFCPGGRGRTAPAEVPSDALTTHLELLDELTHEAAVPGARPPRCQESGGRTYRMQVGFEDGSVTEIRGDTHPGCSGRTRDGSTVSGPDELGVYGTVMRAFGRQYAEQFTAVDLGEPLTCPDDPFAPDRSDRDGASAALDTGYLLGARAPMVMPLGAVRGITCTWEYGADTPTARTLSPDEAERVRIGLHAIPGGVVDCATSRRPTHLAIVEDETGTRRAVTILESQCATVIRSDEGYGLTFPWLDTP